MKDKKTLWQITEVTLCLLFVVLSFTTEFPRALSALGWFVAATFCFRK